jgi:ubiquitin C-terminal hydrolase
MVLETIPLDKHIVGWEKRSCIDKVSKVKKNPNNVYNVEYKVKLREQIRLYQCGSVNGNPILGQVEEQEDLNLDSLLQKMCKSETIEKSQGWRCETCKSVQEASKTDRIYSIGSYFIIQLKRFTDNGKITKMVEYPIDNLNMRPYLHPNVTGPQNYSLQAVILHIGSLDNGHYSCISRSSDGATWINHDDERLRGVDLDLVVDSNAYILVYSKNDEKKEKSSSKK